MGQPVLPHDVRRPLGSGEVVGTTGAQTDVPLPEPTTLTGDGSAPFEPAEDAVGDPQLLLDLGVLTSRVLTSDTVS
jgi:hypothetical protein